ncbi:MAG: alpha/beta fold hydrolase [Egibacteraceae bacterium]
MDRRSSIRADLAAIVRFARPLKHDVGPPLPPPLPEGRVVNLPGRGEVFIRQGPDSPGPAVLLLHGWALSADLNWFSGVYEVAARHGRMVAIDHRGHGRGLRSDEPFSLEEAADDVAALITHLGLGPVVLVGYSMGGSIALLLSRRHRHLTAGLVLVATGLQWRGSTRERLLWSTMVVLEYGHRLGNPKGLVNRYLQDAAERTSALKPYVGWLKAEARRGDLSDLAAAGRNVATFDARPFAADVDVPTAVVITARDRIVRRERQQELAAAIPRARTVEVEGAHNAWLLHPEVFAAAIDEALRLVLPCCQAGLGANAEPDPHNPPRPGFGQGRWHAPPSEQTDA